MARIIKSGLIKVPTQPKDFDLTATELVFRSYDNQPALEFNIEKQDGTPADLLGATLRLLMYVYDEVDGTVTKEPVPFITKNLITESFLNGHVKYILPEALKAYNGVVETYVYIEYPDGTTSDNIGFTFRMKRSEIDGLAQDKADYFIEDFQQLLQQASLEANKTIEGLDTEIKNLQQAAKDANTAVDGAMDRIDGLEAEIEQLERLREMYIDTLDFGDYDYSGNPNLSAKLNASSFSSGTGATVTDDGDEIVFTLDDTTQLQKYALRTQTPISSGKQYTISCEIMLESDFVGDPSGIRLQHVYMPGGIITLQTDTVPKNELNKWQKLTGTRTVNYSSNMPNDWYPIFRNIGSSKLSGTLRLRNIKIEEGPTATPYQPNLLAEPYNMCREYPNENMIPGTNLPVTTSNQLITQQELISYLVKGKAYTVTLKGTKPSAQGFSVFIADNGNNKMGDMKPVEGLSDCWRLTFTYNRETQTSGTKQLRIYQKNTPLGSCKIEWLKIEEGEVSTPIDVPTYKGLGILDTNDPTKYVWNYTELVDVDGIQDALEHVEQRTLVLEDEQEKLDGRLTNVNSTLNTVQSTADQILAEVTAADVMKETDLPSYLANKPIVAGGSADFAGKVTAKKHPCPHNLAVFALPLEHADQAPSVMFKYEPSQAHYDKIGKLDDAVQLVTTKTSNNVAVLGMKFDLISQISKDYPTFFDDCATTAEKVKKIQTYIEGAILTIYGQGISSNIEVSAATGNTWSANVTFQQGTQQYEIVYNQLKQNLFTRARVQDDGSMIFRAHSKALATESLVGLRVDYVRLDYTLNLSSDDFITPIERDVTKDNLTQILSDDSATIKGVMDFKFKTRGNNNLCPHAVYLKSTSAQATNMSEITYEADADMYSKTQNKNDGLASILRPEATTGYVGQAKYKFDLVTAIEREYPHLFKGLTTTKQKVDVLKAKMQELKFNIWCRTEGATGNIEIGSSLSNADAIDTLKAYDVGQTTEYALATYHSANNTESAKRINDDGTILYFTHGTTADATYTAPKVIIDYVNLEYTLSDKPSDYVVAKTDATYLAALAKLQELDRYKEYFDKGTEFGTSTTKLTSLEPGTSKALHGTRAVTVSGGTFKATKACRLYFDFSVKFRGATTTPYIYIKVYKNGVEADIEAVAAVGGMRGADGKNVTLKYQTNAPLKYIVDVNVDDTIEFKIDMGDSPNTIQSCRMLYGTVEEI